MKIAKPKSKSVWKKRMLISLIVVFGLALVGVSYWNLSPAPKAFLIKKAFEGGTFVQSDNYDNALKETRIVRDINYKSKFPDGTLDIVYPKNHTEKTPVIFWVHGGGFVGGDKSDITGYAVELAARGYTVVNINYALAPKREYPTPVLQLGEAYEYIKENVKKYDLKLDRVYFAGDSAGAQISGQFVNIQTSEEYAKLTKIDAIVDPSTIKGVLLFCGPYNMSELAKIESTKEIQDFMRTTGWAYLGKKNWEGSSEVKIASILNHVTNNYPPAFITDGNTGSFEEQGKTLASALQSKGVPVDSLFFDKNISGELAHEFQFKMNTQAGLETFNKVLEFLSENK
ncbi:TPA: alpha/beta hydrolase fold domain-containing protein [Bacillus cereus]|uniref:alpha/beta hydrolase n=1 Tax=Bacillus TaxID=1386 RepID=UPI00065BB7A1|nr:alpha/beta hydrolase [Bacillus mycoides]KMQ16229.1 acetyl esterase [Bacillus mycoides]HDR3890820.1 alpha/beta hydrolase fold domain-containing protein [Bacillus cereus]HDR7613831.1 alpha/beta hydrolase fold domain-containing protein [Bacillus mycoides]